MLAFLATLSFGRLSLARLGGIAAEGCNGCHGGGDTTTVSVDTTYPGQQELCNDIDDNCDGRVDEDVRPTCGVGWCRAYAAACSTPSVCYPGAPREEECNLFDDDCDGIDDNGTDLERCGAPGLTRQLGQCVPVGDTGTDAGRATTGSDGGEGVADVPGAQDPGASPPPAGEASGCTVSHATRARGAWWMVAGSSFVAIQAARRARSRKRAIRGARSPRHANRRDR